MFQSHAGSIEAPELKARLAAIFRRFNPTLVRLRQTSHPKTKEVGVMFQSHAGSIEALLSRR